MPNTSKLSKANKAKRLACLKKLKEQQAAAPAQDAPEPEQQAEAAPAATINAEPKPCKGRSGRKPGSTLEDYLVKDWHKQVLVATTAEGNGPLTRARAAACNASTKTCMLQQTHQVLLQKTPDDLAQARPSTDLQQEPLPEQMPGLSALDSFAASGGVSAEIFDDRLIRLQLQLDDLERAKLYSGLQDTKADHARAEGFIAKHSKQERHLWRIRQTGAHKDVVPEVCQDHGDSPTPRSSSSLKRQPVKPASVDQAAAAFVRPASKAATRPAPPDPADPSPPSCIKETFTLPPVIRKDELEMGERFAFGGFGDVYSAKWRGRLVAVKRLKDAKLKDPEARRLMLLECARHHDLVHPCVLHAYGIVDDGDWLAIVTPLMLHGSVQQAYEMLAEDGIWDDELMVKVLLKVACALEWLHARGYVHMDLKCANILLDLTDPDEPVVMLADLGLTKFKRADWFTSGTGCGTMQWMAPEHFGLLPGVQLSCKVDTWSFACTMWEMLHSCKYTPFGSPDGKASKQQMRSGLHLQNGVRPAIPAAWRERCPKLVLLMEACWAWHPEDRPDFTTVAKELKSILDSMQAVAPD